MFISIACGVKGASEGNLTSALDIATIVEP
jgi:hypothetical protein